MDQAKAEFVRNRTEKGKWKEAEISNVLKTHYEMDRGREKRSKSSKTVPCTRWFKGGAKLLLPIEAKHQIKSFQCFGLTEDTLTWMS